MKLEIQIPDELYARYELQARARSISVKREIQERLDHFIDAPATDRVILVRTTARQQLEKILNCSLLDDTDLASRVDRLAHLEIGEVHVDFTPGQLQEMAVRARKNARSFKEELAMSVRSVQSLVFDRV